MLKEQRETNLFAHFEYFYIIWIKKFFLLKNNEYYKINE